MIHLTSPAALRVLTPPVAAGPDALHAYLDEVSAALVQLLGSEHPNGDAGVALAAVREHREWVLATRADRKTGRLT